MLTSKRSRWIIPCSNLRTRAHNAWLLVESAEGEYRWGAVEVWWERCERVIQDEYPELTPTTR
jgi:hypothetical protein